MALPGVHSTLKRLRSRYKLIILNEDTFEEVIRFRLTRWTVYVALSTLFILLVGLTVALILFTPLKLYIPGYREDAGVKEYQTLKRRTDSLEENLIQKQQYLDNIQKVLNGGIVPRDTARLRPRDVPGSPD